MFRAPFEGLESEQVPRPQSANPPSAVSIDGKDFDISSHVYWGSSADIGTVSSDSVPRKICYYFAPLRNCGDRYSAS